MDSVFPLCAYHCKEKQIDAKDSTRRKIIVPSETHGRTEALHCLDVECQLFGTFVQMIDVTQSVQLRSSHRMDVRIVRLEWLIQQTRSRTGQIDDVINQLEDELELVQNVLMFALQKMERAKR